MAMWVEYLLTAMAGVGVLVLFLFLTGLALWVWAVLERLAKR